MDELSNPIAVDFPLKGEWFAPNTPAKTIPSHGTDTLGQRYAFDFVMAADWSGDSKTPFHGKTWRYYLLGLPLSQWHGWGQNVYAPCDGRIIVAKDGLKERQRVHMISDLFAVLKNGLFFNPKRDDVQCVTGNYIIMQINTVYALFAHFQKGSICISEGQEVKAGELLGRVGHSGNSTAPHLHFQLMDRSDLLNAKGIPCAFKHYERFVNGEWQKVIKGIPTHQERIRKLK